MSKLVDASVNCNILGSLRRKHLKKLIIPHLNVNSVRNNISYKSNQSKSFNGFRN